jgi:hypothetical protein
MEKLPRQAAGQAADRYPMRKVTTPVPVEGGVAGGALPMSAGTSFHVRRKPNGSACQRRTMASVQDEAKRAMSATSPWKSNDRELSGSQAENPRFTEWDRPSVSPGSARP